MDDVLRFEDEPLAPMEIQLVLLSHLPAEPERDAEFLNCSLLGLMGEVEKALKALQDPNVSRGGLSPLMAAVMQSHLEMTRLLIEARAQLERADREGKRALHLAASHGDPRVVRLLLDAGAQREAVDLGGQTPLHVGAVEGQVEVVRVLLAAGAKQDGHGGRRPLHDAAEFGHLEVVELLLEAAADLEAPAEGLRPLHLAAAHGHAEVVRRLLDSAAELGATDPLERTALHAAAGQGHLDVVGLLLDGGAPVVADRDGRWPAELARQQGHLQVAQLLKRRSWKSTARRGQGRCGQDLRDFLVEGARNALTGRRKAKVELPSEDTDEAVGSPKKLAKPPRLARKRTFGVLEGFRPADTAQAGIKGKTPRI